MTPPPAPPPAPPAPPSLAAPDDAQRAAIRRALARWREHRQASEAPGAAPAPASGPGSGPGSGPAAGAGVTDAADLDIELLDLELVAGGRPGVLDVVATMGGRLAHAVLGLRRPGDELHVIGAVDEPALGFVEDDVGMAVVVDALHDADAARMLAGAVAPFPAHAGGGPPVVSVLADEEERFTLGIGGAVSLSVFPWLHRGPHPGVAMLAALDEVGFNHVAAPLAIWRRAGRDLGVAQETLVGAAGGWALALTSLRDLFATGGDPAAAGGDFAPEAVGLGRMAARLHLALDRAFGRRAGDLATWMEAAAAALGDAPAGTDAEALASAMELLRTSGLRLPAIRTHGDLHLGRTARTDHGWMLADPMPGGCDPHTDEPVFRSPLADVADLVWSLRRVAVAAATPLGPGSGLPGHGAMAEAWGARNRRALFAGYLSTPDIGGLVPADRDAVRRLVAVLEAVRAASPPRSPRRGADDDGGERP